MTLRISISEIRTLRLREVDFPKITQKVSDITGRHNRSLSEVKGSGPFFQVKSPHWAL